MNRHGSIIPLQETDVDCETSSWLDENLDLETAMGVRSRSHPCWYLLEDLQKYPEENLLPENQDTVNNLRLLGCSMEDSGAHAPESRIPSIYTYFGQFIVHDVTSLKMSPELMQLNECVRPLTLREIRKKVRNARTGQLDLDSVYDWPAPSSKGEMLLSRVSPKSKGFGRNDPPPDEENDLPRRKRSADPLRDREALIGEPRNDENLFLAQLHVAFLRAHNNLVRRGLSFREAREQLQLHYQWIVLHDYLKRVADPRIVQEALDRSALGARAMPGKCVMPLEFSVAACRFGHSMVRPKYFINGLLRREQDLSEAFAFTALSGQLASVLETRRGIGDSDTLPSSWIIEWEHFTDGYPPKNRARRIGPTLIEPLFNLPDETGSEKPGDDARLAVRNLLRGYQLRIPTGQSVARALGEQVLSPDEIEDAVPDNQKAVLRASRFSERTPLWYYVLAEAAHFNGDGKRDHLGPVGSTLVAEVLVGLVRKSRNSILRIPGWRPALGPHPGQFTLWDLLGVADVLIV